VRRLLDQERSCSFAGAANNKLGWKTVALNKKDFSLFFRKSVEMVPKCCTLDPNCGLYTGGWSKPFPPRRKYNVLELVKDFSKCMKQQATGNALSPTVESHVDGTVTADIDDDLCRQPWADVSSTFKFVTDIFLHHLDLAARQPSND